MKRIVFYAVTVFSLGVVSWGVGGCGGGESTQNIDGQYRITTAPLICTPYLPGAFTLSTDGDSVALNSEDISLNGTIDDSGNINFFDQSSNGIAFACGAEPDGDELIVDCAIADPSAPTAIECNGIVYAKE